MKYLLDTNVVCEAIGFNMDVMDSLIAATALVHQLTVITRNTADFPADVKIFNPWRP